MAGPVYFISDAHLGSSADPRADEPRLERLIPFLRHVGDQGAERLYILGDLFDFWFEYIHVMPWRHARILTEIRALVDRGVPVDFLGGNHDWWCGPVFEEFVGMRVHRDPFSVEHQGKRLFLHHGDGVSTASDGGYLFLKRILRNRWVIRLLRLVHPDLAYALGHHLSRFSRHHFTGRRFQIQPDLARAIDGHLAAGHDALLMGHLHARYFEERPLGLLFILGDWMSIFSALRLENGEFQWEDWSDGTPREVEDPTAVIQGGHDD